MNETVVKYTSQTGDLPVAGIADAFQTMALRTFGENVIGSETDIRSVLEPGDRLIKVTFEVVETYGEPA